MRPPISWSYRNCELFHGRFIATLNEKGPFDLIFTSPPYNIGSKCPAILGERKNGGKDTKSFGSIRDYPDSLPEDEYQQSQKGFLVWSARHLTDNGVLVYNHKIRRKNGSMVFPHEWFPPDNVLHKIDFIVWNRKSTHNHCPGFCYDTCEFLYVFCKPGAKYCFNNIGGIGARSVWDDIFKASKKESNGHNAPFPGKLADRVLSIWSKEGDLVCDPYSGSGTTMKSAYRLGRNFIGSEKELKYFHNSVQSFQDMIDSRRISE